MLSPMPIVSITQPWQRNKLLDFTRNKSNRQHLQEKFYIKDQAEDNWEKILKTFGKYQDKGQNMKEIRVQPQISLWDRTTGIPLKVSMNVMEQGHDLQTQLERPHVDHKGGR